MPQFEYIDYAIEGKVAIVTLCSPDGLNTISVESAGEWVEAVELANADEHIGAIVFNSTGKGFSAGADITKLLVPKALGDEPYQEDDTYTGGIGLLSVDWVKLIRESKPVIVAFDGFAIGGGATFFLPADVLLASERAQFSFPFAQVGIVPEMCSTHYLPARVGFGRASELCLTGRTVDGEEALRIGLVDYLEPSSTVLEKAKAIAQKIANNSPEALSRTKSLLDKNILEQDTDQVWLRESNALRECFGSDAHKEAIKPFMGAKQE